MDETQVVFLEAQQLKNLMTVDAVILVDVREADEFKAGHIRGAINMPISAFHMETLDNMLAENEKSLAFVCAVGQRSFGVANKVREHLDCSVYNLEGGLRNWARSGFKLFAEA